MLTAAMTARRYLLVISACLACSSAWAGSVRVENPTGSITVRTVAGAQNVEVRASVASRANRQDDVKLTEQPGQLLIQCQPADGARVDLEIAVPQPANLEAVTDNGAIRINGLIRGADLVTSSGDIRLSMPWELMRLRVVSEEKPKQFNAPKVKGVRFQSGRWGSFWIMYDPDPNVDDTEYVYVSPQVRRSQGIRGPSGRANLLVSGRRLATYGEIRVSARSPGRLEIEDAPLPENSWVKPTRDAAAILDALPGRPAKAGGGKQGATVSKSGAPAAVPDANPVFMSNVRLVTLSVPVYDREGRPVPGLKPEDFEVLEDGVPQKVALAASEELPFNLVLLLDWSGSTVEERPAMKEAVRGFVGMARPQDRVAVYALADDLFEVLWPLTTDHTQALESVESLPGTPASTPLYGAIVLSYAQEALHRTQERSALVVLSDGCDNAERHPGIISSPPFEKVRSAVAEMNVLLYPILLPSQIPSVSYPRLPSERMQQLADASGGRLFRATSIRNLASVYAQVAEELRSVYTIGYYPQNQNFDGNYRRIQVRVKRPGLTLRTRPGYYAW
jgi:Ca-activated chloride channel family protein